MKEKRKMTALLLALTLLFCAAPTAFAEGSAPIAENLELRTYRNVSVGGRLTAFDPEDDVVNYTITTEPVKGSVELDESGCFVYTPKENKRGRDYFGYKAVDSEGNLSQEATVIIRIEKQKSAVCYSDLKGEACAYAATALSEYGVFTGERIGMSLCFCPRQSVTRGEFLSMCMALTGHAPMRAVASSGYADDALTPAWARAYAVTARRTGLAPEGESLRAEEAISAAEAAELLSRALKLTDVRYLPAEEETSQASRNLRAYGIPVSLGSKVLTRAEAAEMLAAALDFLEK